MLTGTISSLSYMIIGWVQKSLVTGREAVNQLFINQTIVIEFTGGHICVSMHRNIKQKWERKQKEDKKMENTDSEYKL